MPTASSATRSTAAASSVRTRSSNNTRSASGGGASAANKSSAASSAKTPAAGCKAGPSDDASAAAHPPMATAEIVEKATSSLRGLSTRDALTVWKALGLYLRDQLVQRRRVVAVDRFGLFGFNAASEAVFLHNAVFLQSNRLQEVVTSHGLRGQPALSAAAEPVGKVNAAEIGQEYLQNCGREVVASVVAHVVAFVGTMAKLGRPLRLSLLPLGEWVCASDRAEFTFLPEFQQQMLRTASMAKAVDDPSKKPKAKAPDEMRLKGDGQRRQETREPEAALTTETLEAHTTREAVAKKKASERASSSDQRSNTERGSQQSSSSITRREGWSENSRPPTQRSQKRTTACGKTAQAAADGVVARVRAKLLERCGERGLNALQRVLSLLDASGDGELSAQELKFGLRDLGVELSTSELRQVVAHFDRNGDGVVSLDELLNGLRGGEPSERRRRLIDKAFNCMDTTRRGVVSLADLRENYDVSLLPRVRAGKKTKQQALAAFLREWETSVERNNAVPREAFVEYYQNVSACMVDDSDFELLMRHTWHVAPSEDESSASERDEEAEEEEDEGGVPPRALGQARARHDATPTPPRDDQTPHDEWAYLRSVLLPPRVGVHTQPRLDDVCRRLGVNRVWGDGNETMNSRAFENALGVLDRQLHSKDRHHLAHVVLQSCAAALGDMISLAAVYERLMSPQVPLAGRPAATTTATATGVVDRIRARLLQRLQAQAADGEHTAVPAFLGLNALQRTLRLMDSNGDKRLSKDELKVGLRKIGVDVNFHELDQLFTCLDADRSGCVDADEFLVAMRGGDEALTANPRRLALMHKAFDLLDRDRDGSVTLAELSEAYDTSKHAEVLAGRMSAEEALRQFAQQWDTQDKDGVVTRREFEIYYRNVSAVVDSDDYFELMMRNAWHLSGGADQCANSSNRRVLVTKADGSQSVREIQNDLGIRASDAATIHANLRAQGLDAAEVAVVGYVEDERKSRGGRSQHVTAATSRDRPWRAESRLEKVVVPKAEPGKRSVAMKQERAPSGHSAGGNSAASVTTRASARSEERPSRNAARTDIFGSMDDHGRHVTAEDTASRAKLQRGELRQLRERAALLIQAQFRGFRCRKFADCVRRQMAAAALRRQREEQEQAPRRRVVTRAALKSYYGF